MLRPIQSAAGGAGARVDRGGRGRRVLPGGGLTSRFLTGQA